MKIYTNTGELKYESFTFPDGQPHLKLELEGHDRNLATIETAIEVPSDLFQVLLAVDVLDKYGIQRINLDVRYLMGARMDRAIGVDQPFTLKIVSDVVNYCGFNRVRLLDVHSEVAADLIETSENVLPLATFWKTLNDFKAEPEIICPDKGATKRVAQFAQGPFVQCEKARDPHTGTLNGFKVLKDRVAPDCYIVDDICDGGGTFVGLAKVLREHGAKRVSLFVTHGIFSKGLPLEGIDHVYTTDSLNPTMPNGLRDYLTVFPIKMSDIP